MSHNSEFEQLEAVIGRRVRALRKLRGWSQVDLGLRLDLHQTSVAKLESAGRSIRVNELATLAAIFDVRLEDLLTETTEEDPEIVAAEAEVHRRRLQRLTLALEYRRALVCFDEARITMDEARTAMDEADAASRPAETRLAELRAAAAI
jgi:transcriptional regulator with XRE-family HTH domain